MPFGSSRYGSRRFGGGTGTLIPAPSIPGSSYGTEEYGKELYAGEGPLEAPGGAPGTPTGPPIPAVTPLRETRETLEVVIVDREGNRLRGIPQCTVDSIEWDLNDVDSAQITFHALTPGLVDRSTVPPTVYPRLRRDEIQIWHENKLMFWGVPWRRRVNGGDGSTEIQLEGVGSYLKQRFVTNASMEFNDVDQANIAVGIIEYAQGRGYGNRQPFRDLNIGYAEIEPTGHSRYRIYDREKHENLLDLLMEFPELKDGFDWAFIPHGDGRREFTVYYPSRGTLRTNLVIELARNIGDISVDEDATKLVNESWFSGANSGQVKLENTYIDKESAAFYGIAQSMSSDSDEYDVNWLLEEAQRETETNRTPSMTPEILALPTPVELLGVLEPGDTIPVRIDYGQLQIQDDYRITKIAWSPSSDTSKAVNINLQSKAARIPGDTAPTAPNPSVIGTYTDWGFNLAGGYAFNYDYCITIDVENNPATDWYFWSQQFAHALPGQPTYGGYFGIQSDNLGKRMLAAIWDAMDARTGDFGSTAEPFGGEGEGYHIAIPYNWIRGRKYRLRTWSLETEGGGTWWGFWIADLTSGIEKYVGSIKVPLLSGYTLVGGYNTCFTERYGGVPILKCSDIGQVTARWSDEKMNNGAVPPDYMQGHLANGTCHTSMVDSPAAWTSRHQMGIR